MATRKTGPLARPPAIGEIFTRWSVLGKAPSRREDHGSRAYVQCRCECGTEREVMVKSLRSGSSRSCGCLMLQAISVRKSAVGECYGHVTVIAEAEDRFRPSGAYTRHVRAQCGCGRVFDDLALPSAARTHNLLRSPEPQNDSRHAMTHPHTERG